MLSRFGGLTGVTAAGGAAAHPRGREASVSRAPESRVAAFKNAGPEGICAARSPAAQAPIAWRRKSGPVADVRKRRSGLSA
jgi:hypothetical protein